MGLAIYFFFILLVSSGADNTRVGCKTTKGDIEIEVYRDWAPLGADRFLELVRDSFFTGKTVTIDIYLFKSLSIDIALYRCVPKFLTQFGISDNPEKKHWHNAEIPDDLNLNLGIKKYYISFAGGGPNTRSTQIFIAFEDLDFLGKSPWETPFAKVVAGFDAVDNFYKGYGDMPPWGKGPEQGKVHNKGNAYIRSEFPLIDFINSCSIIEPDVKNSPPLHEDKSNKVLATQEIVKVTHEDNLRKEKEPISLRMDASEVALAEQPQDHDDEYLSRRAALAAVVLLLVAVAVLCCLYQYHSAPISSKSL
jgi:peptidyl-prolyl cis-trans isomerase A (cyclophilin A)